MLRWDLGRLGAQEALKSVQDQLETELELFVVVVASLAELHDDFGQVWIVVPAVSDSRLRGPPRSNRKGPGRDPCPALPLGPNTQCLFPSYIASFSIRRAGWDQHPPFG